uniref:Uncharacterized protein n=1 Tax=Lotus japonicus TaxID=34305 RepID=I3S9G6_LOTJA|nr:unknown [Lotus japonicus]
MFHDFVDIVERKLSLWKLGDGRNVPMIRAKRGYIHVLTRWSLCLQLIERMILSFWVNDRSMYINCGAAYLVSQSQEKAWRKL